MALGITQPVYCTREDVKRAIDIKETARNNFQIDRAIQSSSRNIDKHMHRRFYPHDATRYFDWPNYQRAYPWRLWLEKNELADTTSNVPVVTSGGTVIPSSAIFWGPWNDAPPYTRLELDRSKSYSFGGGAASTPQRSISITGTFGYSMDTDPGGALAAAVVSTSATTITVSDDSLIGVGSLLIIDSERLLVSDRAFADTAISYNGASTQSQADNVIAVADSTQFHVGEVLRINTEDMLLVDIQGNNLVVERAWDGTILAAHTTGTIYARRLLTVMRGQFGTTAATHLNAAAISVHRPPTLIRDLCIAEATTRILSETSGYAEGGGGEGTPHGLTAALPDLWDEAETGYARKNRSRVV